MEKGRIITHANSNSSRVVLNNTVYENICSTGADGSRHGSVPENTRFKQIPLESCQNTLVSRKYRNVNQKEQILLNMLEKNLSRQKQSALQSQAYSMQKYKQRLAGYERLRMSGGESIIENCIPPPGDLLKCGDRQSRSKTVSGKSTHASSSISRAKQGDQSIAEADVNRAREDEQEEEELRVYNDAVSPCDAHFHQLPRPGETTISKGSSLLTTILKSSKSRSEIHRTRKKLSFDDNTDNIDMLRKPHPTSSTTDPNLLTVDEEGIRPRAYTDPTSDGKLKAGIKLPEIMIEDCSDPEDKSNTEEGMFTVFASPPRRRANTCPEEFFNRRRKGRPPTPPPTSRNSSPTNKFSFLPTNKSPVSFVHHKLSKVSEDGVEGVGAGRSGSHMSRRSVSNRRSSLNSVCTLGTSLQHKLTLEESEPAPLCDISERKPPDGCHSVTKPEARKTPENNSTSGFQNQGQDVPERYSSKDCRFSQKMSPSLDGKPLEAC